MDGCLTDIRKTLGDKLLDKAIENARYLFCFTCIVKEFDEEKGNLEAERGTIAQLFDKATQKDKDVKFNAQRWKEQVDKHFQIQEDTKKEPSCFLGFCPDCIWRYKRGKELATKIKEMKNLRQEKFENVELTRCLPGAERYSSQYYISFKSRELKYKELLDALKDDNNYMVGLHGMGGAGKTTLAKEVGKQLKTLEHFKYVIDTTVSFNLDIKKIQDDIAGSIGLEWGDINESDRPKRLWSRLTNGDKILVILDDVWENLNFDVIGLPNSDNHTGCKVLVTTRYLWVCKKMTCGKTIQLELLTEEDAWIMFKKHADLSNISSKSILDKGRKIAIECKRLPVAIATIASSLKGLNSREEWDVALNSLKKPVSMGNVDDELVDIFKCLKFSYDYLKDEKAKGLFLLCSAFPEDEEIPVELLTRLGIGVNLFGEGYDKYNDARSQAIKAKNKLLNSCLLLETKKGDVKMHDLVREVAQWIAKEEILAVNLFEKNQKSLVERSKNIKCLFFQGKLMDLFSSRFDGSKLEILIAITSMGDSEDVPTSFFENMVGLRVLNLSNSFSSRHSLSLPKSIQLLINIRSLLIEKVNLGDISVLGTLQSLETLEFKWCEIDEFSPEIAMLKKLRLLCFKQCEIRSNNPFEVIQRCQSLEELYFWKSFNNSCQEITLPTTLERYLLIDYFSDWNGSQSKGVALEGYRLSEATYKYVMKTSYYLHLIGIQGWINLMPEIVPINQGMNDLIELHLDGSSQLQYLVDTKDINSQVPNVFSKLVVLELKRMEALEELCNGPISFDSMNNLEKLYIKECENMRSLFKCKVNLNNLKIVKLEKCSRLVSVFELSNSQSLPLLEELEIIDCEALENIITFERRVMDDNKSCYPLFPKLKVLYIMNCHQLKLERMEDLEELCNGPVSFDSMNNLEELSIKECENLQSLFKRRVNLSNLKTVNLQKCSTLVSVFELSTSQSLPLLEKLIIFDCEKLENIITFERRVMDDIIEESADGYNDKKSCYSLFPKLKVLEIMRCPQLQFILPIFSARDLLLLEVIQISCCLKLEYIFGQHQDVNLPSLKTVEINYLPNFIDIFPPNASSISKHGSKPQTQQGQIKGNKFSLCCYRYKLKSTKTPLDSEDQPQDCSISMESNSHFLSISEPAQCLLRQSHILCNIKDIVLYNVPKIKSVFILSIALRMLETLTIEECDELKQIIIDSTGGNNFGNVFPKLKRLHVKDCVQLEYIFEPYNHNHQNQTECPQLASGDFIKELSGNEENGQQMNLSLDDIELVDLPMMTCLFVGLKYSFVLKNLTTMKIVRCEKLEIVFSTSVLRWLPQLVTLRISECKVLKHIIEDDLEDKISRSSNTFFPKLKTLIVTKCDKLKYVFPVSICKEFPELKFMLIREANELEEIFKSEVEIPNLKVVGFANLPSLCHAQEVHFQAVKHRFVHSCPKLSLTSCNEGGVDSWGSFEDPRLHYQFEKIQRECDKAASEHKLTSPQELMDQHPLGETDTTIKPSQEDNMKTKETAKAEHDEESENDEEAALTFSETDSDYDSGNDDELEGSTSEITAAAETLSTITETKNKPPKQKGIQIYVEEGNTSAKYTKTITSSTHLDAVDSSSGQLVTSECKTSSQELMNEQLMDRQCLMNQQHPLGKTDTSIKPSQEDNLEVSTSEITSAATLSTITETKNKSPTQEGIQINVEEGTSSANAKTITSSTHECKTSSQEDGDSQIAMTSISISTIETHDQGSLINHDSFKKVSSNIEEQFPKDEDKSVSKSKPSPSITSVVAYQFPSMPCKEDPCQKVEDLSSSLLVKSELEQLVSKNHLDWGNFYLLNDFFVKHPSVRLKDTSLSNRYKGCAYNLLAELLKFLKTHSVLEVLGSFHSEFVELLQDARSFGFDKDWLDGVERRALFPDIERQKLLDYKQQVTKDVEGLRLKIGILSEHVEDLKQQLTSSEAVLDGIIQQEVVLSAPIGY